MSDKGLVFNPPPGWPRPPDNWRPPAGWVPDPNWPEPPQGWQLWIPRSAANATPADSDDSAKYQAAPTQGVGDGSAGQQSDNVSRLTLLEAENAALRRQLDSRGEDADELVVLDDERVLQSVGIYRYHHPLENAAAYKSRLSDLGAQIAELVKAGNAIEKSNMFTFDNSLAKAVG